MNGFQWFAAILKGLQDLGNVMIDAMRSKDSKKYDETEGEYSERMDEMAKWSNEYSNKPLDEERDEDK